MSKPLRLRTYLFRVFGATQALQGDFTTRNLYSLSDGQMERLTPLLSKSHGKLRVDTRRDLSRIILINRSDFRWRNAPKEHGPAQTLCNSWKRWSDNWLFARIMVGLAASAEHKTIMIDATYLKAHRTASSLHVKKRACAPNRTNQRVRRIRKLSGGPFPRRTEHQTARCYRCEGAADRVLHVGGPSQRLHRRCGSAGEPAEGGMAAGRQRL